MPMGDASAVDPNAPMGGDPSMGGNAPMDGNMGGDPNAPMDGNMGGDPSMNGDPSMGGDPMMGDMGGDPNAPMGDEDPMGGNEGGDSTMDIINQLSDTDREAVRAYAESMLSRDESAGEGEEGGQIGNDPQGEQPMMESFIFTKKQIMENFGPSQEIIDGEKETSTEKKISNKVSSKSPFNTPKFK